MMIGPEVAAPANAPSASSPAAPAPQAAVERTPVKVPEPVRNALRAANVQFELDAETGRPIVRIVDPGSGQVIRQLPTEEALEIARDLGRLEGLLIRVKA